MKQVSPSIVRFTLKIIRCREPTELPRREGMYSSFHTTGGKEIVAQTSALASGSLRLGPDQ